MFDAMITATAAVSDEASGDHVHLDEHAPIEMALIEFMTADHSPIDHLLYTSHARAFVDFPVRDVVAKALALDAGAIRLTHNHPSGDPSPSRSDIMFTRRLVTALQAIGIAMVDHVIVAKDARFSFRSAGLL